MTAHGRVACARNSTCLGARQQAGREFFLVELAHDSADDSAEFFLVELAHDSADDSAASRQRGVIKPRRDGGFPRRHTLPAGVIKPRQDGAVPAAGVPGTRSACAPKELLAAHEFLAQSGAPPAGGA
jgi:hypothetical protein